MLKLGMTKLWQLDRPVTALGQERHGSLLLLRELIASRPVHEARYNAVIRRVYTANGTWKDTRGDRFRILDEALLDRLRLRPKTPVPLRVLEVGASSAVTSVALFRQLVKLGPVTFDATDLWHGAIVVSCPTQRWMVAFDHAGNPIQYVWRSFVLPGQHRESPVYFVNRALRRLLEVVVLPTAREVIARYRPEQHGDFSTVEAAGFEITKLPLLSVEAIDLSQSDSRFRLGSIDVMQKIPGSFEVVRVMNLLTRTYWRDEQLMVGVGNCASALSEGGFLLLGRSPSLDPRQVRASLYQRSNDQLLLLQQWNDGCEIDDLVSRVRLGDLDAAEARATGEA